MKRAWIAPLTTRPYFVTSVIFLGIIAFGGLVLHWPEDYFAFALLLYLIVTLGIRLDDISRQIGSSFGRPTQIREEDETLVGLLIEIREALSAIDASLTDIRQTLDRSIHDEDRSDTDSTDDA
jgi:hypothetical protein